MTLGLNYEVELVSGLLLSPLGSSDLSLAVEGWDWLTLLLSSAAELAAGVSGLSAAGVSVDAALSHSALVPGSSDAVAAELSDAGAAELAWSELSAAPASLMLTLK